MPKVVFDTSGFVDSPGIEGELGLANIVDNSFGGKIC